MFTPELERRRDLKLQQDRQYFNDLRQQIASNAQRNGTNQAVAIPDSRQYSNRSQPPVPYVSPPSTRSNNMVVPYNARNNSSLPMTPLDPLPDFPQTTIAPLNLEVTRFAIDTVPDLPRPIVHTSAVDSGAFKDRLQLIQSQIDEQQAYYVKSNETAERLRSRTFPSIYQLIAEVDDLLDTTVSANIPGALKYVNELTTHNREQLNAASSNYGSLTDGLRESLDDRLRKSQQLENRLIEFSDGAKNGLLDIRADMGRSRDVLDSTMQKANKLEKRENSIIASLAHYNTEFETIDAKASASFTELVRNITAVTKSAPAQLAASIREASTAREQSAVIIHSQAEEVNKRASERIKEIQDTLSGLTDAFRNSLEDLSDSISDAITQTQNETETSSTDLSRQIDTVISETDANMKAVTAEVVSTISDIRSNFASARDSLESSVLSESQICKENHAAVIKKFDHLRSVVIREREIQESHIQTMLRDTIKNVNDHRTRLMQPAETNIQYIKAKRIDMDRVEAMIDSLEQKSAALRQQISDSISTLHRSIDDTRGYINEARTMAFQSIDSLVDDLKVLEGDDKTSLAKRDFIAEEEAKLNEDTEQRMKFIEKQLKMALQNLASITVGGEAEKSRITLPSSVALQNLVDEKEQAQPKLKVEGEEEVNLNATKKRRHRHKHKEQNNETLKEDEAQEEKVSQDEKIEETNNEEETQEENSSQDEKNSQDENIEEDDDEENVDKDDEEETVVENKKQIEVVE